MPPEAALLTSIAPPQPLLQNGAYGVIRNEAGEVLVVEAENERCYLPGGRIERGETPRLALLREVAEECGWSATVETALGQASQKIMDGAVSLEASYWTVRLGRRLAQAPEHKIRWLPPQEALLSLHRPGDRDAVNRACSAS